MVGIAADGQLFVGIVEEGLDAVLCDILLVILMQHLLVVADDGHEVHVDDTARPVFEHLLHRLQHACGVLSMLAHFLQVALNHVEHLYRILVVLLVELLLLLLHIRLDIPHQSLGEFGEVVDVVQGIEDAVDESLCQFSGGGHLLEPDDLCRAFPYKRLQPHLLFLEPAQSQSEEGIGKGQHQQQVEDVHVPPDVERRNDTELHTRSFGDAVQDVEGLDRERISAW